MCSRVTDTFEQDVLEAGRNGRSARDLSALIADDVGNLSCSSSSDSDSDSDTGAAAGVCVSSLSRERAGCFAG